MSNNITTGFRLSPPQQRLWMLPPVGPKPLYRVQGAVQIEGHLDPERLKQAVAAVVERYEILRTLFRQPAGLSLPVQVIGEVAPAWEAHDLSDEAPAGQEQRVAALAEALGQAPFDLENGPLLRVSLVRLGAESHRLLLSLPALVADSATLAGLVEQIGLAYQGQPLPADDELMQYADLAEWQLELLEGEEGAESRSYWADQLFPARLDAPLPLAHPSLTSAAFSPQSVSLTLEPTLAEQLVEWAEATEASVAQLFLSAWQVLLSRLSGQPELVIGVACDGRTFEELEEALGPLAKYLPLSGQLAETLTFEQVLAQTVEAMDEAFEWQEYFSLAQVAGPERFFPLAFDFEEQPEPVEAGEITLSLIESESCLDRFALKLAGWQSEDRLQATFHYDAGRFEAEDIERLAAQFEQLLASALEQSSAPIGELEILPAEQRRQLLHDFNRTAVEYPRTVCMHHLIERQVLDTPSDPAVWAEGQTLTYAELNTRANQLAHHLRKLGVGPNKLVGVYVERSVEMVVALLGVLKAGGAYVPLDPEYPPERIAFILAETAAPVLLTQRDLAAGLPEHSEHSAQVVQLDADWPAIATENQANPHNGATPDSLAYVIFTSGSTGQPKGVPISQRNLVNSTYARKLYYREPVGRFLLLSSFSFDSSVVGLFWTLCTGGTLLLPAEGMQRDPQALVALIEQQRASHMLALPSLYAYLLAEASRHDLSSLRTVIVAGEACPGAVVERHQTVLPRTALFNEYGPTEGTVWASVFDCRDYQPGRPVPIGRPIANTQLYILDARQRPLPIGVAGELYLGGVGLTGGYLNRPELTAEKFVDSPFVLAEEPNPKSPIQNPKLYRTGDLARYRSDGTIEFLGRIDHQVKIRGYRIELEEIEAVLKQQPEVREAVVVARSRAEAGLDPADTAALVEALAALAEAERDALLAEVERVGQTF